MAHPRSQRPPIILYADQCPLSFSTDGNAGPPGWRTKRREPHLLERDRARLQAASTDGWRELTAEDLRDYASTPAFWELGESGGSLPAPRAWAVPGRRRRTSRQPTKCRVHRWADCFLFFYLTVLSMQGSEWGRARTGCHVFLSRMSRWGRPLLSGC